MGNPPPLSVDPDQLRAAGHALLSAAADLPPAPPPFLPTGSDPLSAAIIGQIPQVEGPIIAQLPVLEAQATKTASNVVAAADAYDATDQHLGGQIQQEMQVPGTAAAAGGTAAGSAAAGASGTAGTAAGSAGSAGSMGQMMSMPMQMAGQMAQMPMQVMQAAAALPQGAMQGVQQVGQQVSQMAGQFGQGVPGAAAGDGARAGTGSGGDLSGAPAAGDTASNDAGPHEKSTLDDGAAAADPHAERAPEHEGRADDAPREAPSPPGRHRVPEPTPGADLRVDL